VAANTARGIAYKQLGDLTRALVDYTKVVELDPNSAESYTNRANVRLSYGDQKGAIEDFSRAIELQPALAEAHSNRAYAHLKSGEMDAAWRDCRRALDLNPNSGWAQGVRGMLYLEEAKFQEAIDNFKNWARFSAASADARYYLGLAYASWSKPAEAETALGDCIALDTEHLDAYLKRAELRRQRGERKGAIEDYAAAIELNPIRQLLAAIYWRRALIHRELRDQDGTINDITEAVRNGLEEPNQYAWRGNAFYAIRDYSNADRDYSTHLEQAPEDTGIRLRRAWARRYLSRFVEALADVEMCLQLGDRGSALHWMVVISSHLNLGELDTALDASHKLVESRETRLTGLKFRSLVYRVRKEWEPAIRDYDEILRVSDDPIDKLWSYFGKAASLRELSKAADARTCLDKAIVLGSKAGDDGLYPMACVTALVGLLRESADVRKADMDQAFDYLQKSFDKGKMFPERLKLDFDAFALRTDGRFASFLD
jgi:tetratricopeptide (TPR) repeat protein